MELASNTPDCDPPSGRAAVTKALNRWSTGDESADQDLAVLVYDDLRRLAGALMRSERQEHTLQPTALVHEAWLRLVDETRFDETQATAVRRKFLKHAVQSMRRILIEHARARGAEKRGGDRLREPFRETLAVGVEEVHELLDLDQALEELSSRQPRAAKIAELRIYGGLSMAETADVVEVALSTAKGEWALAKARLTSRVRGLHAPD